VLAGCAGSAAFDTAGARKPNAASTNMSVNAMRDNFWGEPYAQWERIRRVRNRGEQRKVMRAMSSDDLSKKRLSENECLTPLVDHLTDEQVGRGNNKQDFGLRKFLGVEFGWRIVGI
jgi:hypothetical protein